MSLAGLRARVRGTVLEPGDTGFTEGSRPFNSRYADVIPAAVLSVASVEDVAAGITWARENSVPLVARGGGHSYSGASVTAGGLVLDLRRLDSVSVDADSGLVTAGGGARMKALYAGVQPHDLVFSLGNSDEVSIAGLTLGGGVAAVSRGYGLTCDALLSTDVVLADGTTVTCSADVNPDLFWACQGGGGGNFGVNTSFTFQAQAVRPSATCLLLWEWSHATEVVMCMQEVQRDAPDGLSVRIGLSRAPDGPPMVSVVGWHLGSAEELRSLLAPALAVARPFRADIADRTFWEAKEYVQHETAGGSFAGRTRTTPVPLSEAGVRTLVAAVDKWPGSRNPDGAGAALFGWGGAINRVPVEATAFPHRNTLFLVSLDTSWAVDDGPEVMRDNLDWIGALYEDMGEYASGASYLNFTDPELADWRTAYHGPNLARLVEVKRRYDPDRFFRSHQAL
ncbi:FAD-binding oxidoreductase [Actinokineospora enzanensis]|uniref:FAD-binding oxidoreductase n=1 Tax=Actinokineospora enzanensis TaxID=155975 RepID=UPI0003806AA5|nr:FAD-binding oxidoreductase [Actinokineospora enzanensis]